MVSSNNATLQVTILGDAKDALRALKDAGGGVGDFAGKVAAAGTAFVAFGAVAGGVLAGFGVLSVKTFADLGDSLLEASQRTGLSVEALSQLKFAADQSGGSIEGLEGSVAKMQKALFAAAQGGEGDAFKSLGLSIQELRGLDVEGQFNAIAGALANVQNDTDRAALAMQVFGKSGTSLLPMLADGSAGLQAMREEAGRLGVVLSEADAIAGDKFNDTLGALKAAFGGVQLAIGRGLTPVLGELATFLTEHVAAAQATVTAKVAEFGAWWTESGPAVVAAIRQVVGVAADMAQAFLAGLDAISPLFQFIVENKPVLIAAVVAIGAAIALAFGPAGVAILAIGALITAIGWLRDNWREAGNAIIGFVEGMANGIIKGLNFLADKLGDFLEMVLRPYIAALNKLPGVNIAMPQILEGGGLPRVELPRIGRATFEGGGDEEALGASRGPILAEARAVVRESVTPMLSEATALHREAASARVAADNDTAAATRLLRDAELAAAAVINERTKAEAALLEQQRAMIGVLNGLGQRNVRFAPGVFEQMARAGGLTPIGEFTDITVTDAGGTRPIDRGPVVDVVVP